MRARCMAGLPHGTKARLPYGRTTDSRGSSRQPWQLDGEDASAAGDVARRDLAAVRADALTGDGEPEAQTASILASLLEELEQVLGSSGQAAAFVLDRDEDAIGVCVCPHEDMAPGARELEGVLQQVRDGGREDLSVDLDPDPCGTGGDRELQAPSLRFDGRRDLDLFDELGEQDPLASLDPCLEAYFGERAVDEVAHAPQVAAEHRARAAAHSDASALEDFEGEHRIAEQVPQLVGEEPQPLGLVIRDRQLALAPELGNGLGHRFIEAPVERAKLVGRDRRVQLDGQLGDGLADVPIVVDDLGRGEPDLLQGLAVFGRAQADLMVGRADPPVDSSMCNVAMSWSRNRGTPVASSIGVARGAGLEATFARRSRSVSRGASRGRWTTRQLILQLTCHRCRAA